MTPVTGNLIAASTLILCGTWSFGTSETPSPTALIPVVSGGILLLLHWGIKKGNKVVAHIAVLLTLLIGVSLFMPLRGAIDRADWMAVGRVAAMIAVCIFAIVLYIRSFREVRRRRNAESDGRLKSN
jgi:hypothetical protein